MLLPSLTAVLKSSWPSWVGYRYLRSKKTSRFVSFVTILSLCGVGLGVAALVVVMSVMDGFQGELKKRLMNSDLHILIQPKTTAKTFENGFVESQELERTGLTKVLLENPLIETVSPVVATDVLMRAGNKVLGAVLKGVASDRLTGLTRDKLVEKVDESMLFETVDGEGLRFPSIFIGKEMSQMSGLIPGDVVTIISPTETQGPLEAVPRLRKFVIEGVYSSGTPEQELHVIFSSDLEVRRFLRKKNVVSAWEIALKDFDRAPEVAASLRSVSEQYQVRDWIQLNSSLFASLKLERLAMFVIVAFVVIVASFNIVTTLTLMVLEKKKEIAILKAMGADNSAIAGVFLSEGLAIGMVGGGGGVLVAFLICLFLKNTNLIKLPDIYFDRTLPVTFDPWVYLAVGVAAFVIVLAACVSPAKRAAGLTPLQGMRG